MSCNLSFLFSVGSTVLLYLFPSPFLSLPAFVSLSFSISVFNSSFYCCNSTAGSCFISSSFVTVEMVRLKAPDSVWAFFSLSGYPARWKLGRASRLTFISGYLEVSVEGNCSNLVGSFRLHHLLSDRPIARAQFHQAARLVFIAFLCWPKNGSCCTVALAVRTNHEASEMILYRPVLKGVPSRIIVFTHLSYFFFLSFTTLPKNFVLH